jgi:hypothetical protein
MMPGMYFVELVEINLVLLERIILLHLSLDYNRVP